MHGVPEIDIHAAKAMFDADAATFVDVRDPDSYESSRVAGACHLGDQNVQAFLDTAERRRPLVVYCYHGNSSLQATAWLLARGFEQVFSMSGGFEAWRANYPHECG